MDAPLKRRVTARRQLRRLGLYANHDSHACPNGGHLPAITGGSALAGRLLREGGPAVGRRFQIIRYIRFQSGGCWTSRGTHKVQPFWSAATKIIASIADKPPPEAWLRRPVAGILHSCNRSHTACFSAREEVAATPRQSDDRSDMDLPGRGGVDRVSRAARGGKPRSSVHVCAGRATLCLHKRRRSVAEGQPGDLGPRCGRDAPRGGFDGAVERALDQLRTDERVRIGGVSRRRSCAAALDGPRAAVSRGRAHPAPLRSGDYDPEDHPERRVS